MSVLSGHEIARRVRKGCAVGREEIFRGGTWEPDLLRSAAYDLRVASDYLITPDGTRYWEGRTDGPKERIAPFILAPGEVAFVSSVEDLCMPLDLAGNLAPRFRRALEGILVMGGLLVDPGYCGRLHFQLANIGNKPFEIQPNQTSVAALQLLPVEGKSSKPKGTPSSLPLLPSLFDGESSDPLPPLAFFSNVSDLRGDVNHAQALIDKQRIKLDSTKRSTDQLVVFGVFLLSVTLFSVAMAALIEALASGSASEAADMVGNADVGGGLSHDAVIPTIVLVVVAVTFCLAMLGGAIYLLKPRGDKSVTD
ncbi:MAG TPA: hypothetical protein VMR96_05765 [Solirubrobacterales bacterium]|nr:hypothetical protein [Solirubrobacterales bacterium]